MSNIENQTTGSPVITESAEDQARLNAAAAGAKTALAARAAAKAAARAQGQREEAPRQREGDFGGLRLKMHVGGVIEGYHLYWENDQDSAIEQLLYDGFEFVTPAEVSQQRMIVADGDIAHRISRYVGVKADNTPLRAYLMKVKEEIWQEREQSRYQQADNWDRAIKQSMDNPSSQGRGRYMPEGIKHSVNFNTRATVDLSTSE